MSNMKLLRIEKRKTGTVAVFLRDANREHDYDPKTDCMILPLAGVRGRIENLRKAGKTCLATEQALSEWPN